jgi:hypothetical protein
MHDYKIGDFVKITPFYQAHYVKWAESIKDKPAVVKSVKSWMISAAGLGREDRAMYQAMYGVQSQYELVELFVEIENKLYEVSQFGFSKV